MPCSMTRLFLALTLTLSVGPSLAGAPELPAASHATVTLMIFSGRPNPNWVLSAEQTAEFHARMARLPSAGTTQAPPDALGYSGFWVAFLDEPRRRQVVRIGRGHVTIEIVKTARHLADPDRVMERWLLQTAGDRLAPEVRAIVQTELDAQ